MTLLDAAYSLEELAAGRVPERSRLLAGALALDTLKLRGEASRDILDAAAGLEILARGGVLEFDAIGRTRAAQFAVVARQLAEKQRG